MTIIARKRRVKPPLPFYFYFFLSIITIRDNLLPVTALASTHSITKLADTTEKDIAMSDDLIGSVFLYDRVSDYKRHVNPLKDGINTMAWYLHKSKNISLDEALEAVKNIVGKQGLSPLSPRKVNYVTKNEGGDRMEVQGTLHRYIMNSVKQRHSISPTLTTYLPTDKYDSINRILQKRLKKTRSAKKTEMFKAEQAGNTFLKTLKDAGQKADKLGMNSNSGQLSVASTATYLSTGHPTLTSNGRVCTSYGNAVVEKFLAGNRHYKDYEVTLENLVTIAKECDKETISTVMEKYQLHYPSTDEIIGMIIRCTRYYWNNAKEHGIIRKFIETLEPVEKAAILYSGDFYHIRKYNDTFTRTFFHDISSKEIEGIEIQEDVLKRLNAAQKVLVTQACLDECMATLNDLDETTRAKTKSVSIDKIVNQKDMQVVKSVASRLFKALEQYKDFFKAFFVNTLVPSSIANYPDSVRHVIPTSDTDSCIFTTDEWCQWYTGNLLFSQKNYQVQATLVYILGEIIKHTLATITANIGFCEEDRFTMSMKNEYRMDIYAITLMTKHYAATENSREQNVYAHGELLKKGVNLIGSNIDKETMGYFDKWVECIFEVLGKGKKLKPKEVVQYVANVEHKLYKRLDDGDRSVFKTNELKDKEAYSGEDDKTIYRYHLFWNEIFGNKYGRMPEPPYEICHISVDLNSSTKTKKWIENIADNDIKMNLLAYLKRVNKKSIGEVIRVPQEILLEYEVIDELIPVMNKRKIINIATSAFYILLASLGIYVNNDKSKRMVSDDVTPTFTPEGEFDLSMDRFMSDEIITAPLMETY